MAEASASHSARISAAIRSIRERSTSIRSQLGITGVPASNVVNEAVSTGSDRTVSSQERNASAGVDPISAAASTASAKKVLLVSLWSSVPRIERKRARRSAAAWRVAMVGLSRLTLGVLT